MAKQVTAIQLRIFELIKAKPDISFDELRDAVGLPRTTAQSHVISLRTLGYLGKKKKNVFVILK